MNLQDALIEREQRNDDIVNVDEPSLQLVIVQISDERFAFNGRAIQEILGQTTLFSIPGCPESMEGVIHLRGNIESVIHLNGMLHLPPSEVNDRSRILIAKSEAMQTGIRVDSIIDVTDTVISSIQPPPTGLPAHLEALVSGIMTYEQHPVVLLDIDKTLSLYASSLT